MHSVLLNLVLLGPRVHTEDKGRFMSHVMRLSRGSGRVPSRSKGSIRIVKGYWLSFVALSWFGWGGVSGRFSNQELHDLKRGRKHPVFHHLVLIGGGGVGGSRMKACKL